MMLYNAPEALRNILSTSAVTLPIFVGELTSLTEEGIAIKMLDGSPSASYLGMSESIYHPMYQVFIRTSSYAIGATNAQVIKETLDKYNNGSLLSLTLEGDIAYLGKSPQKLNEFQLLFTAILKEE